MSESQTQVEQPSEIPVKDKNTENTTSSNSSLRITRANFPNEVSVKFITTTYPKKVAETPFKVPSDLTRMGLSEIVNHLLGHEKPTPFEFLIVKNEKRVFLRTSLKDFFIKIQQWPETDIVLEYMEAQPAPKAIDTIPHDDWVSAIKFVPYENDINKSYVVTGCYDGVTRVIDYKGEIIATAKHKRPVTNLRAFYINDEIKIITTTRDQKARVWKFGNFDGKYRCKLEMVLKGHEQFVECVDVNPVRNMAVTGSSDKQIRLWQIDGKDNLKMEKEEDEEPQPKKAKKVDKRKLEKSPIGVLEGHLSTVTALCWQKEGILYSGSYDHTIRVWDITRAKNIQTTNGNKAITDMSYSEDHGLMLSAHPDKIVRLWDLRAENTTPTRFKSHRGWVRRVQWSPSPEKKYQFVSCGDDNMIKIWDIRSNIPLHSIPHFVKKSEDEELQRKQPHQVLAVDWAEFSVFNEIYSGGTDCMLKKHTFK